MGLPPNGDKEHSQPQLAVLAPCHFHIGRIFAGKSELAVCGVSQVADSHVPLLKLPRVGSTPVSKAM